MPRRIRRQLVNLVLFGCALALVLCLNRPSSEDRTLAWTTVRYQTSATKLPASRGVCPGLKGSHKPALVVSHVDSDGDPKWIDGLSDLYHPCVYEIDGHGSVRAQESPFLQVPANRGHEAMSYLTFMIDNYETVPAAGAVFVHGSRFAWHNDDINYDNLALLRALNVSAALQPGGYHNLRCDWSAGTCPRHTTAQGSLETAMRAMIEPNNARVVSDAALPRALADLFGGDRLSAATHHRLALLTGSDAVRAQCCAQFVVARERIWQHSKEEYVAVRQWLLDGSSQPQASRGAAPRDDLVAGRVLSYIWHILFTQHSETVVHDSQSGGGIHLGNLNTWSCPPAEACYCRLYGRCNLEGCDHPGYCSGQYQLPPQMKLPPDWAATHS